MMNGTEGTETTEASRVLLGLAETVELIERQLADVDSSAQKRWLGRRPEAWDLSRSRSDTPGAPAPTAP